MASLRTLTELATWTRRDVAVVSNDPFAEMVLEEASTLVCEIAEHFEWMEDPSQAPPTARRICLAVAARVYMNPDLESRTGLGPLSSSIPERLVTGNDLTESERLDLEKLRGSAGGGLQGLHILRLAANNGYTDTLYVQDNSYGLGGHDPIPYLDPAQDGAIVTDEDTVVP